MKTSIAFIFVIDCNLNIVNNDIVAYSNLWGNSQDDTMKNQNDSYNA